MTHEQLEEYIPVLFERMEAILKGKNHDYTSLGGDAFANFRQSEEFGVDPLIALCIRMGDKFKRVQTFCKNGELMVQNEAVDDAFRDLIGYSVLALAMFSEKQYP